METNFTLKSEDKMKGIDIQNITPFLWFNNQAEEAANFYASTFTNSKIKKIIRYGAEGAEITGLQKGSVMSVDFEIDGVEFAAINGGPVFEITPVISFFVNCDTPQEIDTLWKKLSEGGTVIMKLDKYPFNEKYGWIQDKFGVSWQLIRSSQKQKITPCLMFAGEQHKKAEEAINFYISIFSNSNIIQLERYRADQGPKGAIVHARFALNGQEFIAMDSHMELPYDFNPAISFVVNCETQEEIDYYWINLGEGGDKMAQQCGWLKDKYGVSWQIIPKALIEMMNNSDPEIVGKVMQSIFQMKKIDISVLKLAYGEI